MTYELLKNPINLGKNYAKSKPVLKCSLINQSHNDSHLE